MKNRILIFVSVIFAIVLCSVNALSINANANEATTFEISGVNTEPGSVVEMSVSVKNNTGILGGAFKLTYDAVLSLKSAEAGEAFSKLALTKPGSYVSGCKFVWDGVELSSEDIKDGEALKLTFEVSEEAVAGSAYTVQVEFEDMIDNSLNPVEISACSGNVSINSSSETVELTSITAVKTKNVYNVGEQIDASDIVVTAHYSDGNQKVVDTFQTNVSELDMRSPGEKDLLISYTEENVTKTATLVITVNGNNPRLTIKDCVALPGDQVVVDLVISGNPGILGMAVKVSYDSKLKLTSIESGKAFEKLTMTKPGSMESGCKILWDGTDIDESGIVDGVIAKLTFNVSEELSLGEKLIITAVCENPVDKNLNEVKITSQSGAVTVAELTGIEVTKQKKEYKQGDLLKLDDLVVHATYNGYPTRQIINYFTNVARIDMNTVGTKKLIIEYSEGGITKQAELEIKVLEKEKTPESKTVTSPVKYEKLSDGTIKIESWTSNDVNLVIPEKIDGYSVSEIGKEAFKNKKNIQSVKLPKSLKTIYASAFEGCTGLKQVTIPGNTLMGTSVFYGCTSLTNVVIESGKVAINTSTFENCKELTTITIPATVTKIYSRAFAGTNLSTINYGGTLEQWNAIAIASGNSRLSTARIIASNGILEPPVVGLRFTANKITYRISSISPATVEVVLCNKNKKAISIPDDVAYRGSYYSVTQINTGALKKAKKLKTLYIYAESLSIKSGAFKGATKLSTIFLDANPSKVKVHKKAFSGLKKKQIKNMTIYVPDKYVKKYKKKLKKIYKGDII